MLSKEKVSIEYWLELSVSSICWMTCTYSLCIIGLASSKSSVQSSAKLLETRALKLFTSDTYLRTRKSDSVPWIYWQDTSLTLPSLRMTLNCQISTEKKVMISLSRHRQSLRSIQTILSACVFIRSLEDRSSRLNNIASRVVSSLKVKPAPSNTPKHKQHQIVM